LREKRGKSPERVALRRLGAALLADIGGLEDDAIAEWSGRDGLYVPEGKRREIDAIREAAADPDSSPPRWLAEIQRRRWRRMSRDRRSKIYLTRAMLLESEASQARWGALLEGGSGKNPEGRSAASLGTRELEAFRARRRKAKEKAAEGRRDWVQLRGWPWWPLDQEGVLPQEGELPAEWWLRPLVVETFRDWLSPQATRGRRANGRPRAPTRRA
jgi:hypothetical protein